MSKAEKNENTPFSCPPSFLVKIDAAARQAMLNRSAYIRIAIVEKMERDAAKTAVVTQELQY